MTVLMAIVQDGEVYLAADGVSSVHGGAHSMPTVPGGKFVLKEVPEPLVVGVCGKNRITQELRYRWEPPDVTAEKEPDVALAAILDHLQAHLLAETLKPLVVDDDGDLEGEFLVAFRGAVYLVFGDFCFLGTERGYAALGSGMDVALGALFASSGRSIRDRFLIALEACATYREEVRGPWEFVSLPS